MDEKEDTVLARRTLTAELDAVVGRSEFAPLPDTPEPNPAKKANRVLTVLQSDAILMRFMQRMEAMHEESLRRIQGVEKTVLDNSSSIKQIINSLEFHGEEVKHLNEKTEELENKIIRLEKENVDLRDKYSDLESYKRRWNRRIAGIPEKAGENVKQMIIDLFSQVSPSIAADLPYGVDFAHRSL